MVNPIKGSPVGFLKTPLEKKPTKKADSRVKKIVTRSQMQASAKAPKNLKASKTITAQEAHLAAEKASYAARQRTFETKKAALKAQKAALLAQRAHMAQQMAAAKRARAAEKANKEALKAAKRAAALRRRAKIKAYLARPEEKKHNKILKKYLETPFKKKKQ